MARLTASWSRFNCDNLRSGQNFGNTQVEVERIDIDDPRRCSGNLVNTSSYLLIVEKKITSRFVYTTFRVYGGGGFVPGRLQRGEATKMKATDGKDAIEWMPG